MSILVYMVVVDENISKYILLLWKILGINIRRFFWILWLHPENPIGRYIIWRTSFRIAKQLEQEFNHDQQ